MKRVFIVHGWGYNPKSNWYPWLKDKLEEKGFEVIVPEMPDTENPKIDSWVNHLKETVKEINKDTYFIGHSIGCQTIMRFLESQNEKIGGAVFVAGWFKLYDLENEEVDKIAHPWLNKTINLKKVNENMNKLTVILSDNDPYNGVKENSKIFKERLNAKVIIEKNKGHYDKVNELKIALKEFLEISK